MVKAEILKQKSYDFLWIDGQLWMWDIPNERAMQKRLADSPYGEVLVAGYGLGIVQGYLLKNKKVTSVVSIEKFKEIVTECNRLHGKINGEVIIGDFYDCPEEKKFDCVIGDIWQDISEEFLDEYIKFKNKAEKLLKPGGKMLAWGMGFYEYSINQNHASLVH